MGDYYNNPGYNPGYTYGQGSAYAHGGAYGQQDAYSGTTYTGGSGTWSGAPTPTIQRSATESTRSTTRSFASSTIKKFEKGTRVLSGFDPAAEAARIKKPKRYQWQIAAYDLPWATVEQWLHREFPHADRSVYFQATISADDRYVFDAPERQTTADRQSLERLRPRKTGHRNRSVSPGH